MKWHFERQTAPSGEVPEQVASEGKSQAQAASQAAPPIAPAAAKSATKVTPVKSVVPAAPSPHRSSARHEHAESGTQQLLLRITDLGLAATVLVLPFVMGGRLAIGHLVFCALASVIAIAWSLHQFLDRCPRYRWNWAEPLLLAGVGLVALQVIPLPAEWITRLSPNLHESIPLWQTDEGRALGLANWQTLSLTPHDTQRSLIVILAGAIVLFVALQRIRTADDVHRVFHWCAWSTLLMAAFGIVQFAFGNGKFFWVYEHPMTTTSSQAKGAFTNANHFANFIAMGIPLWLWMLAESHHARERSGGNRHRDRRGEWSAGRAHGAARQRAQGLAAVAALGVIALGLLLSQSRGGLLIGCGGGLFALVVLWMQQRLPSRSALTLCSIGTAMIAAVAFFGETVTHAIESNFHQLASADMNQLDEGNVRQQLWEAARLGHADFPYVGTGVSSHSEVYWRYHDHPHSGKEASHAESGYFQLALETGLTGLVILGLCILLTCGWCISGLRRHGKSSTGSLAAVAAAVLLINYVHSVTDFVWYAPGCMALVIAIAACARCVAGLPRHDARVGDSSPSRLALLTSAPVRLGWGAVALAAGAFAVWSLPLKLAQTNAEQHWFAFMRCEKVELPVDDVDGREAQLLAESKHLLAAVQADPNDHRAQYRLAQRCISLFQLHQSKSESPFPLVHFHDAAIAMSPDVRDEWLSRPAVIGPRMKYLDAAWNCTLKSIRLCPLQARAYLQLADLGWLHDIEPEAESALIAQAQAARPFDAAVHLRLGTIAWSEQRLEDGLAHFQEAFARDVRYRQPMLESMYRQFPAAFFLENFDLDLQMLAMLKSLYKQSDDVRGYAQVLETLADRSVEAAEQANGEDAINHWLQAFRCYRELQMDADADRALRSAFERNPNSEELRLAMAKWDFDHQRFESAAEHYRWCYRENPGDQSLRELAEESARQAGTNVTPVGLIQ